MYIGLKRTQYIELDAIDKVDTAKQTLRLNKYGWFHFSGLPVTAINTIPENAAEVSAIHIVKPNKAVMTAGCCGHCWNYKGKTMPRRLTLRELLLTSTINWKNYTRIDPINLTGK